MSITDWISQFLFDRKIRGLTPGTLAYHDKSLRRFKQFCQSQGINEITEITPSTLRSFLDSMSHLSPYTIRNTFKSVSAMLTWYEQEEVEPGWRSPASKVQAPKVPDAPIQPLPLADALKVIRKCPSDDLGIRDRAILMILLDTGIRASELTALDLDDFDLVSGQLLIRHGKGNKTRAVYAGKDTRKAMRSWLAIRDSYSDALFISLDDKTRLTYSGLRWVILRRFENARVKPQGIHTFRRLFALTMLRNGTDIVTLSRLMGHSTTDILKKYLAQTDEDLREASAKASPIDNAL